MLENSFCLLLKNIIYEYKFGGGGVGAFRKQDVGYEHWKETDLMYECYSFIVNIMTRKPYGVNPIC